MKFLKKTNLLTVISLSVTLASCSFFDNDKPSLAADKEIKDGIESNIENGQINLTINEDLISAKRFIAQYVSQLPRPSKNSSWFRRGYVPTENMQIARKPKDYENYSVGGEPKRAFDISAIPLIAEDKIFTLGGQGELQARLLSKPSKRLWQTTVEKEFLHDNRKDADWLDDVEAFIKDKDEFLGGNICYSLGQVFVTTKRGNLFAVDANSGQLNWRKNLEAPVRSSPIAKNNIVIASTTESNTFAVDAKTGETLWEHEGGEEKNKLSSSPAHLIIGNKVIVTYSSGEIYALNLEDGEEIWDTAVSPEKITILLPTNNDIPYTPVYYKGAIIVVSAEGTVYALEESSGEEIWRFEGESIIKSPWVVSGFAFMTSRFGELFAVSVKSGDLLWRKHLADVEQIDEDDLVFSATIMANDEIYVADNDGTLRTYSPKDGKLNSEIDIADDIYQSPIVADGKMFLLSNESDLLILE